MEFIEDHYKQIAPIFYGTMGECAHRGSEDTRYHPVCYRAWLEMESITIPVQALVYCRYRDKPLVEERCFRPGIRIYTEETTHSNESRGGVDGQCHCEGSSRWGRCTKSKRSAGHRKVPWGMDYRDSSGRRGCPNGSDIPLVPRTGPRCARGTQAVPTLGRPAREITLIDGPGI